MIKFEQNTKTFSDCTAGYKVILDKIYTVEEFIQYILTRDEWGTIGIYDENQSWFKSGNPYCEYREDELISEMPKDILCKQVLSVDASGGWRNMNYKIHLER